MTHHFKSIAQFKRKRMSNRAIALTLHLSRNTVNKAVKIMEASGISCFEIEALSHSDLTQKSINHCATLNT